MELETFMSTDMFDNLLFVDMFVLMEGFEVLIEDVVIRVD